MKTLVKNTLLGCLAAIALTACIESNEPSYEQSSRVHVGDYAPNFTVEMLDTNALTLTDLRGKIVLLTLFSPSCPDCHAQFEHTKEQIATFDPTKFRFIPIARNEKRTAVEKFRLDNGYTFDMGYDPNGEIYALYATRYVPRNYLIASDGVVIATSAEPTEKQLDELLQKVSQLLK